VQAGVLEALPRVDLETARDLQRCQQTSDVPHSGLRDSAAHALEVSSSVADASEHGSLAAGSHGEGAHRKEHILLRRPKEDSASSDVGPASGRIDCPSVWDSYDAEEEALLMQGSSSTSMHAADSRQTNHRSSADSMHDDRPSSGSGVSSREACTSQANGKSPSAGYRNDVVPFSKKEVLRESRAGSHAQDGDVSRMPETSGREVHSSAAEQAGQTREARGMPGARHISNGQRLNREKGGEAAFVLRQLDRNPSVAVKKPRTRRGAADVDTAQLPGGLKTAEHKGHPWIRCKFFALVPIGGARVCSIRDAAGNM
jgi:hypothetical protein